MIIQNSVDRLIYLDLQFCMQSFKAYPITICGSPFYFRSNALNFPPFFFSDKGCQPRTMLSTKDQEPKEKQNLTDERIKMEVSSQSIQPGCKLNFKSIKEFSASSIALLFHPNRKHQKMQRGITFHLLLDLPLRANSRPFRI